MTAVNGPSPHELWEGWEEVDGALLAGSHGPHTE